jgi:ankyrin repeat protein
LLLIFWVFDRSKYYWLGMAGLVSTEPFKAMSDKPSADRIRSYLDRGFDINAKDTNGRTLIYYAINNNLPEIVELLVQRGADVSDSANPIEAEEQQSKNIELRIKYLNKISDPKGEDTLRKEKKEIIDNYVNGVAYYAVRENQIGILKLLLKRRVSLNRTYPDQNKLSFLHLASVHQDGEIVNLLLQQGIDPNIKDALGCTPLHTAIARDLMPYSSRLSSYVNNIDMSSNNAISKQAITYLIRAGANPNQQCNLDFDIRRSSDNAPEHKITTINGLIRSRIHYSQSAYLYSSPAKLLPLFGIANNYLHSSN